MEDLAVTQQPQPQVVNITMPRGAVPLGALDPAAAAAELARVLRAARVAAGNLSLRILGDRAGYSAAQLSRVFAGRARPSAVLLERLAEALGVGTSAYHNVWQPLWEAAHGEPEAASPPRETAPWPATAPPSGGFECPTCGSWVTNPARHIEWHSRVEGGHDLTAAPTRLRPVG